MSKKKVNSILKSFGFKMIAETFHKGETGNIIVCAVSDVGCVCEFFISPSCKCATWQMMSTISIHKAVDCKRMFFEM